MTDDQKSSCELKRCTTGIQKVIKVYNRYTKDVKKVYKRCSTGKPKVFNWYTKVYMYNR